MDNIFIAGTDTDVGKTFTSAVIIQALKLLGRQPYYHKPVASGGRADIDAVRTLGQLDETTSSCPVIFETPCSPHLASEIEKKPINKKELVKKCRDLINSPYCTVIEGAGGTIVPVHRQDFDMHDLMKALNISVLLVTKTGVGTINHTLLTLAFLESKGIQVDGIIFNGYEGSIYEMDNIELIKERTCLPVLGILPKISGRLTPLIIRQLAERHLVDGLNKYLLGGESC